MDRHPQDSDAGDRETRIDGVRDGVSDADATGMVADEEAIARAETLLPLLERPALPAEDLHAALPPDHDAHAAIDRLHAEIASPSPDRGAIEAHVRHLRSLPELEAQIALWWESSATQRFLWNLSQIGL